MLKNSDEEEMRSLKYLAIAVAVWAQSDAAESQEFGPVENFGQNGKLFAISKGPRESRSYFLVSRSSFESEDSSGYGGDARVAITSSQLGGFEIKLFRYVADCNSDQAGVRFSEDNPRGEIFHDVKRGRVPDKTRIVSYNLYWAACEKQFQKFR